MTYKAWPLLALAAIFAGSSHATETSALELYCQVENLERSCDSVRSVEAYRFVRTCLTSTLRSGGYVAFTDDHWRASSVPSFCAGASVEQIRQAIVTHGGVHAPRLLRMTSELTFSQDSKFAALAGISMPGVSAPIVVPTPATPTPSGQPSPVKPQPSRTQPVEPPPQTRTEQRPRSSGTGFAIGAGNVVVTNFHVIEGCSRMAAVANEVLLEAKPLASDETADLAVLRVSGSNLTPLSLSQGPEHLGADIAVLGFPLTSILGNDLRITTGVISSLSGPRGERKLMQISAAVQPGNSGGPVVDQWGAVNGVVVSKLASRFSGENVNFAVRTPVLRSFLEVNGIQFSAHKRAAALRPAEIARKVAPSVVLLHCY